MNPALDFWMPGWIPLEFFRLYRSSSTHRGLLGFGWFHNYDLQLRIEPGRIVYRDEQGSELIFTEEENYTQGEKSLRSFKDGLILSGPDHIKQVFAPRGAGEGIFNLIALEDAHGNTLSLDYERGRLKAIHDSIGRHLRFTHTAAGLIEEVFMEHSSLGQSRLRLLRYVYDADDNLIQVFDRAGLADVYEYDKHKLTCHRNRNGEPTYVEYDRTGRCVSLYRNGGKRLRRMEYDDVKKMTKVTDSLGRSTLYRFNEPGVLVDEIDPTGNRKQRIYDSQNRLIAALGPDENPTLTSTYDKETRTLIQANALGGETTTVLGPSDLPVKITNAEGHTRHHEYDAAGRMTLIRSPMGRQWLYEYDERGTLRKVTCPDGYVIYIECSRDFLTTIVRDEWGLISKRRIDLFGNVIEQVDSAGRKELFEYDGRNRLIEHTQTDGSAIRYTYDGEGNLLSVTDPLRRTTHFTYDGYEMMIGRINPAGDRVRYELDSEDQVIAIVNEVGERTDLAYDLLGRLVKYTYFDGRHEEVQYDNRGNKVAIIDSDGRRTEMEYGPGSLLTRRKLSDDTEQIFTYDQLGRLVVVETSAYKLEYEYDPEGRICREQQAHTILEYEYNTAGFLALTRDTFGREVRFEYTPRRALRQIKDNGRIYELATTPLGEMVTEINFPGGLRQELSYDVRDRLTRRRVISPKRLELARRDYEYDAADQLISMTDIRLGRFTYEYDVAGRLTTVRLAGAIIERYVYDSRDNLISTPLYNRVIVGAGSRVLSAGPRTFEYDDCGRLITLEEAGAVTSYAYDGEGQLSRVDLPNGKTCEFRYDAFVRRTLKQYDGREAKFCWDSNNLRCELTGEQETDRLDHLFLPGTFVPLSQHQGNISYHYSFDQIGTPTEMWDTDGNLVWSMASDAYGATRNEIGSVKNPLHFMGQYVDSETGLYCTGFRYYDPSLGRFTTQDPLGIRVRLNLYIYPTNPMNWVDPLGLFAGPTINVVCREYWSACDQAVAKIKIVTMNKSAQQEQMTRTETCDTAQRDYYEKNCGKTKHSGSTHDIDHLVEKQVGGMDECCANLWEIPRRPNRSIGSQLMHAMNKAGVSKDGGCIGGFAITGCDKAGDCNPPPTPPGPPASCEEATG